jgi:hypothetical protein
MTVKLNLTIQENTAKAIKRYAHRRKTSVSKIAEELFTSTLKKEHSEKDADAFLKKWSGIVTTPIDGNIKDIISEALIEKHAR